MPITRELNCYIVINGDNQPHTIKMLEQYGENLYDVAMYHSPEKTYCVFSVGKHTNKFICCLLNYDEETKMWLGFTPMKSNSVPQLIKTDLKENFIS